MWINTLSVGTFAPTGSMGTGRTEAQAIVLPNGKVLVAGGYNAAGVPIASAELYDPSTGAFLSQPIPLGTLVGSIGFGGGSVWVTVGADRTGHPVLIRVRP